MKLLDTSPERERAHKIQAVQMAAQQLVDAARARGLAAIITLAPRIPPAMGSYDMVFDIRGAPCLELPSPAAGAVMNPAHGLLLCVPGCLGLGPVHDLFGVVG